MVTYQVAVTRLTEGMEHLLACPIWCIGEVIRRMPVEAEVDGVYAISQTGRSEEILYIGRTKTKTIRGRMHDHCRINTGSDLKGILLRWLEYPQDPESYYVRWLAISDPLQRARVELFAIAALGPRFNRF